MLGWFFAGVWRTAGLGYGMECHRHEEDCRASTAFGRHHSVAAHTSCVKPIFFCGQGAQNKKDSRRKLDDRRMHRGLGSDGSLVGIGTG